jgi:hypothetical protein
MKKLTGVKIQKLDFLPVKQGDLLYHEGPLLSVFKDALYGNYYFYKWSDCDEKGHRWLTFKVSIKGLNDFFDKKTSLKELILEQPFSYIIDLDNDINPSQITLVSVENIPKSYLPESDSYFDELDFEVYATIFQKQLENLSLQTV